MSDKQYGIITALWAVSAFAWATEAIASAMTGNDWIAPAFVAVMSVFAIFMNWRIKSLEDELADLFSRHIEILCLISASMAAFDATDGLRGDSIEQATGEGHEV